MIRSLAHSHSQAVDLWGLGALLYVMLSALPPFQTLEDIKARCAGRPLTFEPTAWDHISPEGKALTTGLLSAIDSRLTIDQIYRHPWLKTAAPSNPPSLSPAAPPSLPAPNSLDSPPSPGKATPNSTALTPSELDSKKRASTQQGSTAKRKKPAMTSLE